MNNNEIYKHKLDKEKWKNYNIKHVNSAATGTS